MLRQCSNHCPGYKLCDDQIHPQSDQIHHQSFGIHLQSFRPGCAHLCSCSFCILCWNLNIFIRKLSFFEWPCRAVCNGRGEGGRNWQRKSSQIISAVSLVESWDYFVYLWWLRHLPNAGHPLQWLCFSPLSRTGLPVHSFVTNARPTSHLSVSSSCF